MPISDAEFERFWVAHNLCRSISDAALEFLGNACAGDLRTPLPFVELDTFRAAVAKPFDNRFEDELDASSPAPAKSSHLRVVL